MFWRYNLITGSCIETLLEKENVTLKELMDEEDILQECKAQTRKLLDFLVRPEILDEMVTLILKEPEEEGDERLRYKYANRACEMLTFDITQINDALASDEALLNKLYDYLKTDEPLNPLLASFFSKTMAILISKKTEIMFEFLKQRDFLSLLLKHLNTSAIMDLLLRITMMENNDMRTTIIKWLNDEKLIQLLVSRIDIEYGEDYNCNASNALCDIIKSAREHMSMLQDKADTNPLLEAIESVEVVTDLLNHMFKDVTKESAIVNGVLVLLSLLVFKKQGPAGIQQLGVNVGENQILQADNAPSCFATIFRNSEPEHITALDAERLAGGVDNVLAGIIPRLEDFHNLLLKPPVKPAITFTIGCLDPPLGICRLEVAHLLTALLYINNHEVNIKLATLETIIVLLDMFFKYSWNNFLHTQVEQAIGRIITNPSTVDKEGNKVHPLLDQIFDKYKLTVKIVECFEEEPVKTVPGLHRKGYMGHLTKIANHIAQNIENGVNSNLIKENIQKLPEEHQKKWEIFVTEKLADINKKTAEPTVTNLYDEPVNSSVMDKNKRLGAFSEYQMHEMTSNFVDQFGFNDDDFDDAHESLIYFRNAINPMSSQSFPAADEGNGDRSAELFEEVCSRKLHSDVDAVLWTERENPSFADCFGLNKSTEENSSDSDEESQVFESESAPVTLNSEEMKMDVDGQEQILEGVPMDVVPVTISDPWGTPSSNSGSEEQQNWADFSNFASFDTSNTTASAPAVVAMETSDVTEKSTSTNVTNLAENRCNAAGEPVVENPTGSSPENVQPSSNEKNSLNAVIESKDNNVNDTELSSSQKET